MTAAVFRLDRDNLTMADPDNPGFNRLSGLQRSEGLELSIDANPIDALRLTVNWNHLFSAKYINDNSYAGNTIPNAPENAFGLFASYDLDKTLPGLSLTGRAQLAGCARPVTTMASGPTKIGMAPGA